MLANLLRVCNTGHNNLQYDLFFDIVYREKWKVEISKRIAKQVIKLPKIVKENLIKLILEIEILGPVRGHWKNYGKLGKNKHHCHIKVGHPTYVVCWKIKKEKNN